ncbi:MAG: hypothetical protein IJ480_04490 [Clostridia bacterium]|nr:hypothetical protein [Clostridia bacterium]
MKKQIALLLTLLLIGSSMAACGSAETTETAADTAAAAEETPAEETADPLADNLPEADYEGYSFRITTWYDQVGLEESTGEVLNDAIFRRDLAVEERYNIDIVGDMVANEDYSVCTEAIRQSVIAGTSDWDAGFLHMVSASNAAPEGIFYNLNELPYVDMTKPWWDKDCLTAFTVGGNIKIASTITLVNSALRASCIAFNYKTFDDNGIAYPYDMVTEGTWTLDAMYDIIKDTTHDLNGDGEIRPEDDFFGMTSWYLNSPYTLYYGGGGTLIGYDAEGYPQVDLNLDKNTALFDRIYDIVVTSQSNFETNMSGYDMAYDLFCENRAHLVTLSLSGLREDRFRNMETDYGVVPSPKFDENQEEYYSFVNGAAAMLAVPAGVENPERTGVILEAMGSETYRSVWDVLYEVTVKAKYMRDEQATGMINLIIENRGFDFGYAHMYDNGTMQFMRDLLMKESKDVASTLEKGEASMQTALEKVVAAYQENQ